MEIIFFYLLCRFDIDDPQFLILSEGLEDLNRTFGDGLAADYLPLLKYIPTPAQWKMKRILRQMFECIQENLREHRESYDPSTWAVFKLSNLCLATHVILFIKTQQGQKQK